MSCTEVNCPACGGAGVLYSLEFRDYLSCEMCDESGVIPVPEDAPEISKEIKPC